MVVITGLVRILDRDLLAAGIDKRDERGRTIDVHALRTSFGTLLSKGGVAPRTAQAAMRHSTIDLTMNTYTDPKLLDVAGALDSLPALNLNAAHSTERQSMRATGTDCRDASSTKDRTSELVAPVVAPNIGKRGQSVSFAVISSDDADERTPRRSKHANPMISSEKALSAGFANKAFSVERRGVEPPTSALRTQESRVPSDNLSEVATTDSGACTAACTSEPPKRRKRGADAASVGGVETPAVRATKPVETDFAAALKMLAALPLSDEERAEAVRRLLKGSGGAGG